MSTGYTPRIRRERDSRTGQEVLFIDDYRFVLDRMTLCWVYEDTVLGFMHTVSHEMMEEILRDNSFYPTLVQRIEMDKMKRVKQMFTYGGAPKETPITFKEAFVTPNIIQHEQEFDPTAMLARDAFPVEFQVELVAHIAEIIGVGADPKQSAQDTADTANLVAEYVFTMFESKLREVYDKGRKEG